MEVYFQAVTTVGFSVVACFGLGWYIWEDRKAERAESRAREERMFQQIDKFSASLENFNRTLIGVNQRLENIERKVGIEE